jgi:hypothetical protein
MCRMAVTVYRRLMFGQSSHCVGFGSLSSSSPCVSLLCRASDFKSRHILEQLGQVVCSKMGGGSSFIASFLLLNIETNCQNQEKPTKKTNIINFLLNKKALQRHGSLLVPSFAYCRSNRLLFLLGYWLFDKSPIRIFCPRHVPFVVASSSI